MNIDRHLILGEHLIRGWHGIFQRLPFHSLVPLMSLSKTWKDLVKAYLDGLLLENRLHSTFIIWTDPDTQRLYPRIVYCRFTCKGTVKDLTYRTMDVEQQIQDLRQERLTLEQRIAFWMTHRGVDQLDTQDGWMVYLVAGQVVWQRQSPSFEMEINDAKRRLVQEDPFYIKYT